MNKPLFLFVGKSASGKTTVANMLEKDGCTQIQSYTTRPKRYENETGHIFVTDEEYDKLENIVAFTVYNGYRYCTTLDQVKNADIYVVDVKGVQTLLEHFSLLNRQIYIIFFGTTTYSRIQRMLQRGDSDTAIVSRLLMDEKENWLEQLEQMREENEYKFHISSINANCKLEQVYETVKNLMANFQL